MIFSRKSLLIFSLSVHNRKNLLKFLINFITDRRRSVEYSARFFIFFFEFKIYSFMLVPTFLKKTIIHTGCTTDKLIYEQNILRGGSGPGRWHVIFNLTF